MENSFYTIKNTVDGFYEEKFSKFIAKSYYVEDEKTVNNILEKLKKEYKDARHIVYAYKIGNKFKYSDDGEPQGTAGMPILRIIEGNKLNNILIICIRYFGGILLGTGPLARAYMQATKDLIQNANITKCEEGRKFSFKVDYKDFDIIKNVIERNSGIIENTIFLEKIEITVNILLKNKEKLEKELENVDRKIITYNNTVSYIQSNI